VRQLTLEHFQRPLNVETVTLDAPKTAQQEVLPPLPKGVEDVLNPPVDIQAPPVIVPQVLRAFVPQPDLPAAKVSSRAELLALLTASIPRNEYGLPTIIYRPDLLDHTMFQDVTEEKFDQLLDFLAAATIPITYYEGYPALPNGQPLWAQFTEFESAEDHALFEKYLLLPGARQLALLTGLPTERGNALFHQYYWGLRAQASDAFAVAHYQRMREQRILKTDDKHFLESEKLLTKIFALGTQIDWDSLKSEPDKFVNVLTKLVALQRQSLGISLQHPKDSSNKAAQPVELLMRSLTQTTTATQTNINGQPILTPEGELTQELDIREILAKAPDVGALQELILKIGAK
jgi:hypothetical protein